MRPLQMPLRAVLYREESRWIAHCLELDLVGDGDTQDDALAVLADAIYTQVDAVVHYGNPHGLFRPAEAKYFEMFAAGKNVATGRMEFRTPRTIDSVTIEDLMARVYDGSDSGLCVS